MANMPKLPVVKKAIKKWRHYKVSGIEKHIYWPGSGKHVPTGTKRHNHVSISRTSILHMLMWSHPGRYVWIPGLGLVPTHWLDHTHWEPYSNTNFSHSAFIVCNNSTREIFPRVVNPWQPLPSLAYVGRSCYTKKGLAVTDQCAVVWPIPHLFTCYI